MTSCSMYILIHGKILWHTPTYPHVHKYIAYINLCTKPPTYRCSLNKQWYPKPFFQTFDDPITYRSSLYSSSILSWSIRKRMCLSTKHTHPVRSRTQVRVHRRRNLANSNTPSLVDAVGTGTEIALQVNEWKEPEGNEGVRNRRTGRRT